MRQMSQWKSRMFPIQISNICHENMYRLSLDKVAPDALIDTLSYLNVWQWEGLCYLHTRVFVFLPGQAPLVLGASAGMPTNVT